MAKMDLRDFIGKLKEDGELKEINREVHWNLEASAIASMSAITGGPAVLFNKITGYEEGRLTSGLFAGSQEQPWRRYNIALGLHPDASYNDFMYEFLARAGSVIKPSQVDTGPCKEVIKTGKDVNLFDFPYPYLHYGDGGRYGTVQSLITKNLDTDWVNWGNYRSLILGKNKLSFLMSKGQQAGVMFYQKYEPANTPMPFAIAIGGDPVYFLAAAAYLPEGKNEMDMAGGLRDAPVELVKCETNDLLVPADSEIVIEGVVPPHKRVDEGPFGEYFGFIHGPRRPMPLFQVQCITHRKNPIIPFVCEGLRNTDGQTLATVTWSIGVFAYLAIEKGYPVKRVWMPRETPYNMFIIALDRSTPGMVQEIMDYYFQMGPMTHVDHVAFVDGDVDPRDLTQFVEDWATKMHPKNDLRMTDWNMPKVTLTVYLSPEERKAGLTKKIAFDVTTKDWDESRGPKRINFESLYPEDMHESIVEKWNALDLKEKAELKKVEDVELFIPGMM
jgi:4-hydroxy-3-polyprenylbenzoate decarboxylase